MPFASIQLDLADTDITVRNSSSKSIKKSVRFSHDPPSTSSTSSSRSWNWIRDTCLFLNSSPSWTDRQYLKTEQDAVIFSPEPQDQPSSSKLKVEDLGAFYGSTPRLSDRLQVGLDIALTILGLGTSCWIPRGWDRREVFVLYDPKTSTKPFLRHDSLSFTLGETIDDIRVHTEASLFSLGVVLLELIYQETLEQQPFWDKYCENGQPNDWTHQCTAMEWQSKVEARYGDDLSEAIRLCVEGGFSGDANLDNSDFLREVLDTVVSPLEKFLSGWKRVS